MIDEDMIATLQIQADRIAELEQELDEWKRVALKRLAEARSQRDAAEAKVARLREAAREVFEWAESVAGDTRDRGEAEREVRSIQALEAALKDTQP